MKFFGNLKKSIGVTDDENEKGEKERKESNEEEKKEKETKKEIMGEEREKPGEKERKIEVEEIGEEKGEREEKKEKKKKKWFSAEGELAVDVYQTDSELVVQSAIAGVKGDDLDITIEGDLLEIKGERRNPIQEKRDYFSQECYWGEFSRQIILPVEVDPSRIKASLKNGILTIRFPKIKKEEKIKIEIKD